MAPIDPMDARAIEAALPVSARRLVESLEHLPVTGSTNRYLLGRAAPPAGMARAAVAEFQTAGRGRRGRRWTMPPGAGVALSVSWRFAQAPAALPALSLAVGAAARRAIRDTVGLEAGLKWPNDLIVDEGKLGGILVELDQTGTGACHVVAGIGVNVRLPAGSLDTLSDLPRGARDLAGAAPGWHIDRSALAGGLIAHLIELFAGYAATGFSPYLDEWLAAHVLDGRQVDVLGASKANGTVRGIGPDGALIVETAGGERRRIISGDVSVRAVPDARD